MPWIAPSHQAPVLPLKIWFPAAFSGLALVLGSAVPDLEFMLRLDNDWVFSHTFAAQIYFTLPVTLLLHALLTRLVLPFVVPLLPSGPPLHLDALGALRSFRSPREWRVGAISAVLGGWSHVVLDGITHGNHSGWALAHLPLLAVPVPHLFGPVPLHDSLHFWMSLFFGLATLQTWQYLAREGRLWAWRGEEPTVPPPASPTLRRRTARFLLAGAITGACVGTFLRASAPAMSRLELGTYGALAFLFYGLVAAAAADRGLRALGPRRLARLRPVLELALGG